jgi:cytidylate kinase
MTFHSTPPEPVLVIMEVSGGGKSTVAGLLAGRLGWDLAEGADMHPAANIAEMAVGQPLDDVDRSGRSAVPLMGLPSTQTYLRLATVRS